MKTLHNTIAQIETELAEIDAEIAQAERCKANALADAELGHEPSLAQKNEGEAESRLWDLNTQRQRKAAALAVLIGRRDHPGYPAFEAETDDRVAEALKLRKALDRQMPKIGRATKTLVRALVQAADLQNALMQIDPDFDAYGFGKTSLVNWFNHHLAAYTGQGFMPYTDAVPDLPGSAFSGESTIENNIRHRRERQAEHKFRDNVEGTNDVWANCIVLPIETYSSGMKARLAFGLSLAIDFDCYLIDEITAVGDRRFKEKSSAALNDKIKNARVLMISHAEKTIRDYCQMGVLLYGAQLYYYDSVDALIKDYRRFC